MISSGAMRIEVIPTITTHSVDFELISSETGEPIAFPLPETGTDVTAGAKVLEALWLEERIEEVGGRFRLPVEELYRLDVAEAEALGLPGESDDVAVELRTSGYAGSPDFAIRAVVRHPAYGVLPESSRTGPFFRVGHRLLRVPEPVARLFNVLDRPPQRSLSDQLLFIAQVKNAAEYAGARLDSYLANEHAVTPDGIGVEVEFESPDTAIIRPVFEGLDDDAFPGARAAAGLSRSVYLEVDGPRRRRLVLSPSHRQVLDGLKARSRIRGADVPRFLDNPEAYLPDGIDLSRFSLRVRGLVPKRYNSKPYISLQPTEKRGWFEVGDIQVALATPIVEAAHPAGDQVSGSPFDSTKEYEGEPGENTSPPSISPDEYARLCQQVAETGERYVLHKGAWIEIDLDTAQRYIDAWNAIEKESDGRLHLDATRLPLVLDVISNLDELEFATADTDRPVREVPEYPVPSLLAADLLPHQVYGYRWMRYLYDNGWGGLLADDMGLGKTVQAISLLAHLAEVGRLQPALIVVPKALVTNWQAELGKFLPSLKRIYVHQDHDRLRDPDRIAQAELVLTTYQTLRRDQLVLGQIDWSVIICDEAQYVKNPTAQATSAVKGMKATLRLAVTGTPVENGLSELWCIVDFVQPGKLGSQREFREAFERPIRDSASSPHERRGLATRLQERLYPHYIRRIKEDVLRSLPPKTTSTIEVELGPRQLQLYYGVVQAVRSQQMVPLEAIQHLIAIASHPELFDVTGAPIDELVSECPKLSRTLDLLGEIRAVDEKAVVFTRYRRMQLILQEAVARRFGVHAPIINGELMGHRRLDLVNRFNRLPGFQVLILSPDAAGVGLNVTGANHVIHYTRVWNPAKENQATDRVYRIGQTRPVTVHYPIVVGSGFVSVEQRLAQLLAEKQDLARNVLWPREDLSVFREMSGLFEEPRAA